MQEQEYYRDYVMLKINREDEIYKTLKFDARAAEDDVDYICREAKRGFDNIIRTLLKKTEILEERYKRLEEEKENLEIENEELKAELEKAWDIINDRKSISACGHRGV